MRSAIRFIVIVALLLLGAWWTRGGRLSSHEEPLESKTNLPLTERIVLAENYLEEFRRDSSQVLARIEDASKSGTKKPGRKECMEPVEIYHKRFKSLGLPCPRSRTVKNDQSLGFYRNWTRHHFRSRGVAVNDYLQRIDANLTQAGN